MFKLFAGLLIVILASPASLAQSRDKDYIRLVDPLDAPEFYYCFDLSGRGDQLRLENPVVTHTCKAEEEATDQFVFGIEGDQIQVVGHDRCLQASGSGPITLPGSPVLARACSDSALQKLSLHEDGSIRLADTAFCLTIGDVSGPANGPGQKWRTLSLINCSDADPQLSTWQFGKSIE